MKRKKTHRTLLPLLEDQKWKSEESIGKINKQKSNQSLNGRKPSMVLRKVGSRMGSLRTQVARRKDRVFSVMKKTFKQNEKEKKHDAGGTRYDRTELPLYPQLRDSWMVVNTQYIAKDIHRLIYRITVKTSGINNVLMSPPPIDQRHGGRNAAERVTALVKLLSKRLLNVEESDRIKELCDEKIVEVDDKTDLLQFNREIFSEVGEENPVTKLLRCVHQSMVLKPYGILRTVMIKDKLTKDVRGDDGWQIEIVVANENFIQVIHRRREQSIDFPTPNQQDPKRNHWEYKWEVSMTFDSNMNDMNRSRLSITELILDEGMDPDLEKELREILHDGNITVFD